MAGHSNSSALAPFVSQEIGAPFFVWGVWGLTLAVATSFTINFGTNLPIWDDWAYVFPLKYSLSISWLWALHNEHRLPLPKLLNFALLKVTGIDFRAGMFFNVFGLSFLAFFLIRKARNLRGWIAYTDAFLPLALVSLSQYPIFLWSFQVQFGLFAILLGIFLGIIVSEPNHLDFHAFPAGICLILLPLCGMMGVGVVPALGGWL